MGLKRTQGFVKKEAMREDIALLLITLWRRAEDILYDPLTRISFHGMLLLTVIDGFRPGVLENIKYRQVCLDIICDPTTQEKRLVSIFTLHQNKQRPYVIRQDQKNVYIPGFGSISVPCIFIDSCRLEFSIALVPYGIFCPTSLVIARAISDDAFDPSFNLVYMLFHRPLFEERTKCIQLHWKNALLDKPIFPITYNRFWQL